MFSVSFRSAQRAISPGRVRRSAVLRFAKVAASRLAGSVE
jgi:hypothetical protein